MLTQNDLQTDDHAELMKNLVKCLRPSGVLILADLGKYHHVAEDAEVECWSVKYFVDCCPEFSKNTSYGEDLKGLVLAEESLDLRFNREYLANGNWVNPQDQRGPEIPEIMRKWSPVS